MDWNTGLCMARGYHAPGVFRMPVSPSGSILKCASPEEFHDCTQITTPPNHYGSTNPGWDFRRTIPPLREALRFADWAHDRRMPRWPHRQAPVKHRGKLAARNPHSLNGKELPAFCIELCPIGAG